VIYVFKKKTASSALARTVNLQFLMFLSSGRRCQRVNFNRSRTRDHLKFLADCIPAINYPMFLQKHFEHKICKEVATVWSSFLSELNASLPLQTLARSRLKEHIKKEGQMKGTVERALHAAVEDPECLTDVSKHNRSRDFRLIRCRNHCFPIIGNLLLSLSTGSKSVVTKW